MLLSPASCYLLFGRIYLSTLLSTHTPSPFSPLNVKDHSETTNFSLTAVKYSVLIKTANI